jgi:transposase-like protein
MAKSAGSGAVAAPVGLDAIPPVKIEAPKIEAARSEATTSELPAALPPQAGAEHGGPETDGAADDGETDRPVVTAAEPPVAEKPRDRLVRVRNPAPNCPRCGRQGKVYGTGVGIQYVKCNGCGETWKHIVTPEEADPLTALVVGWVRAARQAEPELHPGSREMVYSIPKSEIEQFISKAEEIVGRIETRKRPEPMRPAVPSTE